MVGEVAPGGDFGSEDVGRGKVDEVPVVAPGDACHIHIKYVLASLRVAGGFRVGADQRQEAGQAELVNFRVEHRGYDGSRGVVELARDFAVVGHGDPDHHVALGVFARTGLEKALQDFHLLWSGDFAERRLPSFQNFFIHVGGVGEGLRL